MPEAKEIDSDFAFELAELQTQVNYLRNHLHMTLKAMDAVQYQLGRVVALAQRDSGAPSSNITWKDVPWYDGNSWKNK